MACSKQILEEGKSDEFTGLRIGVKRDREQQSVEEMDLLDLSWVPNFEFAAEHLSADALKNYAEIMSRRAKLPPFDF